MVSYTREAHAPTYTRHYNAPRVAPTEASDALVTLHVLNGDTTPGVMFHRFNWDQEQAKASMAALSTIDADLVLPGHGEPWPSGVGAAVRAAQET